MADCLKGTGIQAEEWSPTGPLPYGRHDSIGRVARRHPTAGLTTPFMTREGQ